MSENKEAESVGYWMQRCALLKALMELPTIPWEALQVAANVGKKETWETKGLKFFRHGNEWHTTPASYAAVCTAMSIGVTVEQVESQAAPEKIETPPVAEPQTTAVPVEAQPWFGKRFWSRKEAATYLDMSVDTLDRQIGMGRLKNYPCGRKNGVRLKAEEVKRFADRPR